MKKKITVALAGLGSRGKDVYAKAVAMYPEKMEITAIADLDPEKIAMTAERYQIPEERCFSSVEEMLKEDRLADVMFITTQDRQHVGHAIPALQKGYHLLLEKPISPVLEELRQIVRTAKECDRKVVVCHVLRYTPIYRKVKEILDSGRIGEVVSIMASENVGWFHMAHSFVRGNWSNSEETSPMILQKCCHDMDLYLWLANKKCESISSYGNTYYFNREHAPQGCTERCMDGCKVKDTCPFDAESIYLDNKLIGYRSGNRIWPLDVVTAVPTEESIRKELKDGRFGQCVYHCNNNVVDHQVVNLNMTDGTTMSFTMSGFTADISRYARFYGTKGELVVNMDVHELEKNTIRILQFGPDIPEEVIDVASLADDFSGHGGGDNLMVEEFIDILLGNREESSSITSLEKSVESHYCALAAEESRIHGGRVVNLDTYRNTEI